MDHVAVTVGLFVAQTKLKMLISQDILNIYLHMQSGRGTFWASEFLLSLLSMVYLIYGLSVSMCVRLSLGWAVVNTVVR